MRPIPTASPGTRLGEAVEGADDLAHTRGAKRHGAKDHNSRQNSSAEIEGSGHSRLLTFWSMSGLTECGVRLFQLLVAMLSFLPACGIG